MLSLAFKMTEEEGKGPLVNLSLKLATDTKMKAGSPSLKARLSLLAFSYLVGLSGESTLANKSSF